MFFLWISIWKHPDANQTPLATELPVPGLVEYFTHYRRTATLPDLEKYVAEEDEDRL